MSRAPWCSQHGHHAYAPVQICFSRGAAQLEDTVGADRRSSGVVLPICVNVTHGVACRARHDLKRHCNATTPTLFYAYGTSRARPMWAWLYSASTALQWRNYACTLSIWVRATLLCRWPACARHLEPGAGTARDTLRRWRKVSKPGRTRTGNTHLVNRTL